LPLTLLLVSVPVKMAAPADASATPLADLTVTELPVKRVLLMVPAISPAPESPSALPDEPGSAVE